MEAGKCVGTVLHHMLEQNQNTGNWYISVMFQLEGDEKISAKIYINPQSEGCMRIARKSLSAMGFNCDEQSMTELDNNQTLLKGGKVELDIGVDNYQGQEYLKVNWINKIPEPKAPDLLDSFDKALRNAKKRKPDPAPMEPTAAPNDPDLEEPPF